MPAIYAHDRFGAQVFQRMNGDLREIIQKHYTQYQIGLQGPDIFFFYRPYTKNRVNRYGYHLHEVSAYPFFGHGVEVARKKGRNSGAYAYFLGFLCHFILDSECHPYVEEMIVKTGVQHLEIEEEFEKKLLRMDGKDALAYPLASLIPVDWNTARAIAPFYREMQPDTVRASLRWMKLVKRLFTAPGFCKQTVLNTGMRLSGNYPKMKGLMNQRRDNPRCLVSNEGLLRRFDAAVDVAADMMHRLDESVQAGADLPKRLDRTFE